ncbi:MAG: threonine/homoserine/homoserine lactone efflux protein [Paraglaciecola sp.]|jgi:threonine/homoserine/homoserine lactone efflux protein
MEYSALILFTIATSITPGPNNVMIMTSGVNHGFRKSIPHLAGIDLGFPLMLIVIGLGASQIFETNPSLFLWLKIVGVVYLSYLAFKIASSPVQSFERSNSKPFTFFQAALFQWVNPKAWIMCIGAVVTYVSSDQAYFQQLFAIALIFFVFGMPCTVAWLGFGSSLKQVLSKPSYLRIFNVSMALLLLVSLLPVFLELYESFNISMLHSG